MKKSVLALLGLIFAGLLLSETSKIDSLLNDLNSIKRKTDRESQQEKIDILNELSRNYQKESLSTAILYGENALQESENLPYPFGSAQALKNLGLAYYYANDYQKALEFLTKSLSYYENLDMPASVAGTLGNIGIIHYARNDYEIALEYLFRSHKIYQELDHLEGQANSLNNIGNTYFEQGIYDRALEYYNQSLTLNRQIHNIPGRIATLGNIGLINNYLGNYEESLASYLETLELQTRIDDLEGLPSTLGNIGNAYYKLGNYHEALSYYNQVLEIYQERQDNNGIATTLGNIGVVYNSLGSYDNSLEYYLRSLKIKEEMGNVEGASHTLNNIGLIYQKLQNYDKALEYFHNSLKIKLELDNKEGAAATYGNIGIVFKNQQKLEKSLEYNQKALGIYREIGNKNGIAISLNNIGLIKAEMNDTDKALQYCLEALSLYEETGDKNGIAGCSNDIGTLYIRKGDLFRAEQYLDKGLRIALEINARDLIRNSYDSFIELYSIRQDYQKALEMYKSYVTIKDSIFSENIATKIAEMQIKFETEKKEKENEIYRLELEKQRLVKWRLYFSFVLALGLFLVIFLRYRLKAIANRDLEKKVTQALEKQKEQQQIIMHQSSLTSLGELAAGIAHEINQPLQNINFSTQNLLLELREKADDYQEIELNCKDIMEGIGRIRKIIDHIRAFSRDQKDEYLEDFNINTSIQNAHSLIRKNLSARNIKMILQLSNNLPSVKGNPYKFEQVVLNLLSNARDALEEKEELLHSNFNKEIMITTVSDNTQVYLEITDNGIGIKPENQAKIFNPFYTTKKIGQGTGLGLSISYGIIHEMDGNITLKSGYMKGTNFRVSIPLIKDKLCSS